MEEREEKDALAARNRLILVRTLSVVSFLYAGFAFLQGLVFLSASAPGEGLYAPRTYGSLLLVHAVLFGGAGEALWKGRPWAWTAAALAAAGSVFFVALALGKGKPAVAALDGVYPILVLAVFLRARTRT